MNSRVAVITGGASGLGLAIARALGADGWSVALLDFDRESLGASVEDLRTEGVEAEGFHANAADGTEVNDAVARIVQRWGRIDALFANAGISAGPGPAAGGRGIAEVDDANWDHVLAVNLSGVMRSIRACVPHLTAAGGGSIVITSSSAAVRPTLWVGHAYTAAKAALIPLGKVLAIELAGVGIRVNIIAPGLVITDMGNRLVKSMTGEGSEQLDEQNLFPFRRACRPEEIATAVTAGLFETLAIAELPSSSG